MTYNNTKIEDDKFSELEESVEELHELAIELGLSPPPVNYWLVDHDDINKLAAYQGFQTRFRHWRWGMQYSQRVKKDTYFGGKIFELVNHDTPANAFNQISNNIEDQKSVIAHVEAHADFFDNNMYFEDKPEASRMFERHANIIDSYYEDSSISYEEVEEWIDAIMCIQDCIDPLSGLHEVKSENKLDNPTVEDKIESLDVSDEVKKHISIDLDISVDEEKQVDDIEERDVLAYLLRYGKQYNEETGKSEEYEDWQRTILKLLRRESYYFSAQKMTKIMNEGWAAFWESLMMANEGYAKSSEIIQYADKQARVLNSPGFNPYKIGKEIWTYIENKVNRKEVATNLLQVKDINWRNFHDKVNFNEVISCLENNISDDVPCERHYSLLRRQNIGFIQNISKDELKKESRYMFDMNKYSTIEEAIKDVDFEAGWSRMREIRETHNDITFIDEFLTEEFVDKEKYFAYEYNEIAGEMQVSSTSLDDVKKKILLQISNGGKPIVVASDNNYNNKGELLLKHQYNGIELNMSKAKETLKKIFELWGHPVHLKTIVKVPEGETGVLVSYNGTKIVEQKIDNIDDIKADQIDYNTKPDEWLQ